MKMIKYTNSQGRVIGVTVGCILGMTPLLFIGGPKTDDTTTNSAAPSKEPAVVISTA